jgi:hypothetical protein
VQGSVTLLIVSYLSLILDRPVSVGLRSGLCGFGFSFNLAFVDLFGSNKTVSLGTIIDRAGLLSLAIAASWLAMLTESSSITCINF